MSIKEISAQFKAIFTGLSHSLKATLMFWFLLLSIVPFVTVAWYGYDHTVTSVDEMQRNKLSDTAELDVARLNNHFYEAVRDLKSWSRLITPQKMLHTIKGSFTQSGQSIGDFTHGEVYKKLIAHQPKTLVRLAEEYDYVNDLFLIDMEGNILYTVKKEADLGTNLQSGPYAKTRLARVYRESMFDKKAHFSDMERYEPSGNRLTGFITQPILEDSGKMIGIIGLQLNMDVLFSSLKSQGKGIAQYLVGMDGLLRTPIDNDNEILQRRITTDIFWNWYKEHGIHREKSDETNEVAIVYDGPNGTRVLGEHKSIDLLGVRWVYISEIEQSKVMAVPKRLFLTIGIFSLLMLGVVTVASFMIARRIVKPIKILSNATEEYMRGGKGVRVRFDTANEIGAFGRVFNTMIEKQEADEAKLDILAKQAQKTLDELKEQKYALDAHSIVAITDVKGTISFVNKKFEEITGYTSAELIGENHRILNSGLHSQEFWREMYHTVSHGNIWHGEVCNKDKGGALYWVDTTIVPFMDADGKPVSYIAIRTDITERKAIQDSLNEAILLQKAVFENAGVAIITTDTKGLITAFNAAAEEMLGYKAEEVINKETPALFHKLDEMVSRAEELSNELGVNVEPGFQTFVVKTDYNLSNAHEWTYVRKDGSELPVYLNVTALYEADGTTIGYMGIVSDVSLFKEAESQMLIAKEAAEASVRVKSEFLATMSHEIRTPMNGVLGMLGLLSHSDLDEIQRHQVRVALNSANSLLGLINDILDFSKVEAGKMELEMIEFNLRDELGELVEAIAFKAQEKGLELILDTTSLTRSNIITDPGRLRQILTNLIGNAVKFTHSGEICLTVMLDEVDDHFGRLRIDVRDSGIGIPADKIDKLFQTFAQADNSTTRKYGGTGLGLAIVKQLCELMDGSVWITSVENKGSTFHVDIGVGLGEAFALSIPSISVAGKSALVVDDNETNRAVVRAQLEQWGMDVYESVDPISAFDDLQIRISQGYIPPYDVAILDMQMPNMDGAALGAEIRKLPECDAMKMVMMTSLGSRNDAARFAEIGFDAFFAKPATAKDLLNALKVLFDAETELGSTHSFVTKDYLGTLLEETTEVQWPVNTRLLLVDDNPTNQIVAQGMLEMIGLEADVAYNGLEALEAMQVALDIAPYTVVLMDCQMPEMDGYAASIAIREGKAGEANKTVPIIAMTANAMSGDREKCLISGMSDYISKPINLAVLKTTLIKWLKGEAVTASAMSMSDEALKSQTQEPHELQVWDEADALKRLGGKKELLFKIMESFLAESPRLMSALETAIKEGDLANMQLHSHSIKGAAGNVSAQQIQMFAKTLEEAAKNGQEYVLKEGYGSLEQAMREVCTVFQKELSKEIKSVVKKKSYDPLAMAVTLQKLKKEIESGAYIDTDSFDIFNEYSDEIFMGRMNTLKEYIDRFATSEALELLNTIINELE